MKPYNLLAIRARTLCLAFSLMVGLSFHLLSSAIATAASPITVNGINYTPANGTTISTTGPWDDSTNGYPVYIYNKGTILGANNWNLSTTGSSACGIFLTGSSTFSGTGTIINTSGTGNSYGVYAVNSSTLSLTGGTITTLGRDGIGFFISGTSTFNGSNVNIMTSGGRASGLYVDDFSMATLLSSTITSGDFGIHVINNSIVRGTNVVINTPDYGVYASNTSTFIGSNVKITTNTLGVYASARSTITLTGGMVKANTGIRAASGGTFSSVGTVFDIQGDLVAANNTQTITTNVVTLDTVTATNGTNVFIGTGSGTTLLTVRKSKLTGNLVSNDTGVNTVTLSNSSTLTGSSTRNNTSRLNISLDAANTQWQVAGNSTLSNLTNSGTVNMITGDNSRRTMTLNGNFTQQASGLIAMSLSGTGGLANSLVIVESTGSTTVAGGLNLLGDISAINNINNGHFVLFDDQGTSFVSGNFANIKLNGITVSLSALEGTQNGGVFNVDGTDYVFTYAGIAETGDYTGGNDIMITLLNQPVPEPGTWVMMLSGTGILVCYLRARQHSRRRESWAFNSN